MLPYLHSFAAMTTRCELQLHGVDAGQGAAIAARIETRVAALVRRYNFHAPDSWLTRAVNERRSSRVALDAETASVLEVVRQHAERCGGVFDITVGTYAARLKRVRSTTEAAQVRRQLGAYTGLSRWSLDGDALQFDNAVTRIDLGGVIKEYAVDESVRLAREAGVPAGLINYGGDLACWGLKPNGERFVAAVPHPLAPQRMLFGLDLHNQALTTSGHYARQRSVKGGELSHVVGPVERDGASASGKAGEAERQAPSPWLSCSVVSHSALVSGIYSTALLLRGDIALPAEAMALLVDAHGKVHTLEGQGAPAAHTPEHAPAPALAA